MKSQIRNNKGNMLVVVCVTMSLVALILLALTSFGMVFFVKNRLQTAADEIALAGAEKLNEYDRLGQMNNMLARSRELVFSTRQQKSTVESQYVHLQELADGEMNDARAGAQLLEAEQAKLLQAARTDAKNAMKAKFESIKESFKMILPWAQVSMPVMDDADIRFGKVAAVESNVTELGRANNATISDLQQLVDHDRGNSLTRVWPQVQLYRAEQESQAGLPGGDDGDLSYKLSSLTPPVDGTVAPARVLLARNFGAVAAGFLPSAAQVKLTVSVSTAIGPAATENLAATGTAAATGADEQQ